MCEYAGIYFFFFQAEDGIRDLVRSRGLGDVYKRQVLRILTNDLDAPASEIADLYKRRWQIELFFRWVKQTLKIKHFFGRSENAVRIQITVALITFLLLRLAHSPQQTVPGPLALARPVRANHTHRRPPEKPPRPQSPLLVARAWRPRASRGPGAWRPRPAFKTDMDDTARRAMFPQNERLKA